MAQLERNAVPELLVFAVLNLGQVVRGVGARLVATVGRTRPASVATGLDVATFRRALANEGTLLRVADGVAVALSLVIIVGAVAAATCLIAERAD